MWLFCDACRDRRLLNTFRGKQLIGLLDESSSGAETSEVEKNEEKIERNTAENSTITMKKRRGKRKIEKEETILPDSLKISRYMKAGISKKEALQKLIEEKREEAAQKALLRSAVQRGSNDIEENTRTKLKVDPSGMPWSPRYDTFLLSRQSIINRVIDHQRYVAIISNFLDANKSLRYDHNKQEIEAMDEKLSAERKAYQKHVKKIMKALKQHLYMCGNLQSNRFVLERLMKRRSQLSGQYGSPLNIRTDGLEDDISQSLPKVKYNLVSGTMTKIVIPNERRRFTFTNNVEEVREQSPLDRVNQFPLENDELASHFAMKYAVNVITGVSSVLAIMCRPWLADSACYTIPIVVKAVFDTVHGRPKNICILGKPCVLDELNHPSLWRRFMKHSVRIALYPKAKQAQRTGGRQRAVPKKLEAATKIKSIGDGDEKQPNVEKESGDEVGSLVIAEPSKGDDESEAITSKKRRSETEEVAVNDETNPSSVDQRFVNDVLSGIMEEMGSTNIKSRSECDGAIEQRANLENFNGSDLSKRYTIFSIGEEGLDDVLVLIRSGNDGLDSSTGTSVSVAVKLEFAPDHGAERLGDEEWLYDALRCRFKCASHLLRLRIHYSELHFLQKERYEERNMIARDARRKLLIQKRTHLLKSVLLHLEQLEPGSYALRLDAKGRAEILPQITDPLSERVEMDVDKMNEIKACRAVGFAFNGIDEHVALVYHLVQKRIPAAFLPESSKPPKGNRGGRKKDIVASSSANMGNGQYRGRNGPQTYPAAKRKRIDLDAP
uniref:Little elongation complex subunit 2 C-terminal domain-containing protein n=1 Tax=Parascaris univalens TaxID=6257 RepID=A0A914ZLK4_PARUN